MTEPGAEPGVRKYAPLQYVVPLWLVSRLFPRKARREYRWMVAPDIVSGRPMPAEQFLATSGAVANAWWWLVAAAAAVFVGVCILLGVTHAPDTVDHVALFVIMELLCIPMGQFVVLLVGATRARQLVRANLSREIDTRVVVRARDFWIGLVLAAGFAFLFAGGIVFGGN